MGCEWYSWAALGELIRKMHLIFYLRLPGTLKKFDLLPGPWSPRPLPIVVLIYCLDTSIVPGQLLQHLGWARVSLRRSPVISSTLLISKVSWRRPSGRPSLSDATPSCIWPYWQHQGCEQPALRRRNVQSQTRIWHQEDEDNHGEETRVSPVTNLWRQRGRWLIQPCHLTQRHFLKSPIAKDQIRQAMAVYVCRRHGKYKYIIYSMFWENGTQFKKNLIGEFSLFYIYVIFYKIIKLLII